MSIQALLFTRHTPQKYIDDYLKKHGLIQIKATHSTDNFERVRLITPDYKKYVYGIYKFGNPKHKLKAMIIQLPMNKNNFK